MWVTAVNLSEDVVTAIGHYAELSNRVGEVTFLAGALDPSAQVCAAWSARRLSCWLSYSATFERRRSRAMPMLSMKTKKPTKPMLEILTDQQSFQCLHPASDAARYSLES